MKTKFSFVICFLATVMVSEATLAHDNTDAAPTTPALETVVGNVNETSLMQAVVQYQARVLDELKNQAYQELQQIPAAAIIKQELIQATNSLLLATWQQLLPKV